MFKYKPENVPDVEFQQEWDLVDGEKNQLYRAGGWSFDLPEDGNLGDVERAVYAWIAWHDFLEAKEEINNGNK